MDSTGAGRIFLPRHFRLGSSIERAPASSVPRLTSCAGSQSAHQVTDEDNPRGSTRQSNAAPHSRQGKARKPARRTSGACRTTPSRRTRPDSAANRKSPSDARGSGRSHVRQGNGYPRAYQSAGHSSSRSSGNPSGQKNEPSAMPGAKMSANLQSGKRLRQVNRMQAAKLRSALRNRPSRHAAP